MQPYFFPYIGYYQLINYCDDFVVFDNVQYINKGWINRNRIMHPDIDKKWQYITIPLRRHCQTDHINNILINGNINWVDNILGKLTSYKRKAPYYNETIGFMNEVLSIDENNLSRFVIKSLVKTCEYIGIPFRYSVFSEMNLDLPEIKCPGDWALEISSKMGATEYINLPGGVNIFDNEKFRQRNINLLFVRPLNITYSQRREGFVENLSIIDMMMWNSIDEIKKLILDFKIYSYREMLNNV